jgi:hypothetical protein
MPPFSDLIFFLQEFNAKRNIKKGNNSWIFISIGFKKATNLLMAYRFL